VDRTGDARGSPSMRRPWLATPLLALAACDLPFVGPDCIDETRSLSVSGHLASVVPDAAPGDTGVASLGFSEARNHRSKRTSRQDVLWSVRAGIVRGTVTAIHVHEVGTDRLVLGLPIDSTTGPASVITQVFTGQPYAGAIPWSEAYVLLGEGRGYLDVHTTAFPLGQLRGRLEAVYPGWRGFTHAYCS
jgi:hypothetical protein